MGEFKCFSSFPKTQSRIGLFLVSVSFVAPFSQYSTVSWIHYTPVCAHWNISKHQSVGRKVACCFSCVVFCLNFSRNSLHFLFALSDVQKIADAANKGSSISLNSKVRSTRDLNDMLLCSLNCKLKLAYQKILYVCLASNWMTRVKTPKEASNHTFLSFYQKL